MVSVGSTSHEIPPIGRVFSVLTDDPRAPLHWLAMLNHEQHISICVYSRLSPQRLANHISLQSIEFKWLSENQDPHAITPSLEMIHHSISTRIASDGGIIWLDGVEFLISRHGFDGFLSFTRSMTDEISGTNWTLMLPFTPLSLDGTQIAHLRREASPYQLSTTVENVSRGDDPEDEIDESHVELNVDESDDLLAEHTQLPVHQHLKMLSTIVKAALTPAVLTRRIQQWEDMGFDISELEAAKHLTGDERYEIYREVEENIRRAIECERRIQMVELRGHTLEAAKMRFRIMQLTGLSDVESKLDGLLSGSDS